MLTKKKKDEMKRKIDDPYTQVIIPYSVHIQYHRRVPYHHMDICRCDLDLCTPFQSMTINTQNNTSKFSQYILYAQCTYYIHNHWHLFVYIFFSFHTDWYCTSLIIILLLLLLIVEVFFRFSNNNEIFYSKIFCMYFHFVVLCV